MRKEMCVYVECLQRFADILNYWLDLMCKCSSQQRCSCQSLDGVGCQVSNFDEKKFLKVKIRFLFRRNIFNEWFDLI